jgi:hypothetical protein
MMGGLWIAHTEILTRPIALLARSGRVRSRNEYELEAAEKAKQIEGQIVKQVPAE